MSKHSPMAKRSRESSRRREPSPMNPSALASRKNFLTLVLEVALTSGGLDKLEIYRRFAVAEVWFWRKGALEIWTLRRDCSGYDGPAIKSRLLPRLEVGALTRCLRLGSWRQARKAFRGNL